MKVKDAPSLCVCEKPTTVDHLLTCTHGGYGILRHNSLRDLFAELLRVAGCKDVVVEPQLQPINGKQLPTGTIKEDGARLDVSARNIWSPLEKAFLDIRVFHAQAPTNRSHGTIEKMYRCHEQANKRSYNQRVLQVE